MRIAGAAAQRVQRAPQSALPSFGAQQARQTYDITQRKVRKALFL